MKKINMEKQLFITQQKNCKETAEVLISNGANINEKDKNGKTVLHFAVEYYNCCMLRSVIM